MIRQSDAEAEKAANQDAPIRPQCDVVYSNEEEKMETGSVSDDDVRHDGAEGEEIEVEAIKCKICVDPVKPSKEEKERHEAMGHVQYRNWCPACVRGRGQNTPHRSCDRSESELPLVSMDYFFAGEEDNPTATMIAVKDSKSKAIHAYLVEAKGTCDPKIAKRIARWVESLGYKRVAMRTDRENSIVAVQDMVQQEAGMEIVPENSPKGESQSNGPAESAVRELAGMVRTLKDSIETKTGEKIDKRSAMLAWIVEHAGNMITRYRVGKDGKTAYQRLKGKAPSNKVSPLGEKVLYLPLKSAGKQNKLAPKFKYGIMVGVHPRTSEALCANGNGTFRTWTIKRLPEEDRWDAAAIREIVGLPWDFKSSDAPDAEIVVDKIPDAVPPEPVITLRARKFYVTKKDIEKFGFTKGCSGCAAMAKNTKAGPPHNEGCTRRIQARLEETPEGADRVEKRRLAETEALAEHGEAVMRRGAEQEERAMKSRRTEDPEKSTSKNPQLKSNSTSSSSSSSSNTPTLNVSPTCENKDAEMTRAPARSDEGNMSEDATLEDLVRGTGTLVQAPDCEELKRNNDEEDQNNGGGKRQRVLAIEDEIEPAFQVTVANSKKPRNIENKNTLDLTNKRSDGSSWNLSRKKHRKEVLEAMREKPSLVIGNEGTNEMSEKAKGEHVDLMIHIYQVQAEEGRLFMHEQVMSPNEKRRRNIPERLDPIIVTMDESRYKEKKERLIKLTTNSQMIANRMSNVRVKSDKKQRPPRRTTICREVKRGHEEQMEVDDAMEIDWIDYSEEKFYDAITAEELNPTLVKLARAEEIEYYRTMKVYSKVLRSMAWEKTGKAPIKVKWVDHNKGTAECPQIRSRLVAKEIRVSERPELFAATPPLESLKLIISFTASGHDGRRCLMHNDVSRAYFHAPAKRDVFVEIIGEDKEDGDEERCGWLNVSMYGTRDAAQNWEDAYSRALLKVGFTRGISTPCVFRHGTRDIDTMVHGDDFLSSGSKHQLEWMQGELEKVFTLKTKKIGTDPSMDKEMTVLGRQIRFERGGITYEADEKHVKQLVKELNIETAKPVYTAGARSQKKGDEGLESENPMEDAAASRYRASVARCNYLAVDRPDIQYAVKELARWMSKPRLCDQGGLDHLGKYLKTNPRAVQWFEWQGPQDKIICFSDSDWAGCKSTRKSSSGGGIRIGKHIIKTWARTQATMATSSGEAELYAAIKGSCEVLGVQSLAKDFGKIMKSELRVDAKATIGILHRQGLGRMRHVEVGHLWIQQAVKSGRISVKKVLGTENIADLMTKYLDYGTSNKHMEAMGFVQSERK